MTGLKKKFSIKEKGNKETAPKKAIIVNLGNKLNLLFQLSKNTD